MIRSQEVLIVSGETSGDLHAAPVVNEIKKIDPSLTFFGAGGENSKEAGVELLAEVSDLAVMGFSHAWSVLPRLFRLKHQILDRVRRQGVCLAILIDYPGFNFNLGRALKKLPNPPKVLYYIAPQVWAWRRRRANRMSEFVDHLAVVFPFEVSIFQDAGVNTSFVGHPIVEELADSARNRFEGNGNSQKQESPAIALLPGSRLQEIHRHLPVMVNAVELLRGERPSLTVGIGITRNIDKEIYQPFLENRPWLSLWDNSGDLLRQSNAAVVCSGTATLETALISTPQVVIYRTSFLNYHVLKTLIQLKNISLVNIVAGQKIVSEVLQNELTAKRLAEEIKLLLDDSSLRIRITQGYDNVKLSLGFESASRNVALIAKNMLEGGVA